ncbi:MAG: hypothetical protein AAB116_10870 [Candidatus Poribacteria bacterium]
MSQIKDKIFLGAGITCILVGSLMFIHAATAKIIAFQGGAVRADLNTWRWARNINLGFRQVPTERYEIQKNAPTLLSAVVKLDSYKKTKNLYKKAQVKLQQSIDIPEHIVLQNIYITLRKRLLIAINGGVNNKINTAETRMFAKVNKKTKKDSQIIEVVKQNNYGGHKKLVEVAIQQKVNHTQTGMIASMNIHNYGKSETEQIKYSKTPKQITDEIKVKWAQPTQITPVKPDAAVPPDSFSRTDHPVEKEHSLSVSNNNAMSSQSIITVTSPSNGKSDNHTNSDLVSGWDKKIHSTLDNQKKQATPNNLSWLFKKESHSQIPQDDSIKYARIVEAFNWETPVEEAQIESLAAESKWTKAFAPLHWPTLFIDNNNMVPLLSNNSVMLLKKITGATIQFQAGIVFGRVGPGWGVELSGRSEKPIFFNTQNQIVDAAHTENDRYFIFTNVEPGAHLLYFINHETTSGGAVGVPVLRSIATFTDLTKILKRNLQGRILDAVVNDTRGLDKAQIRVVGQPSAAAITNKLGNFSIENVFVVSDFPLFVEVNYGSGYTHRFKIANNKTNGTMLYYFRNKQIKAWISQLEGGVSDESGLVIGAFPRVALEQTGVRLFSTLKTLNADATFFPESYGISVSGQLQVNAPLEPEAPRFLAAQVPEGPALVDIENSSGINVWSEMVMVSPGVVCVITAN